MSELKKQRQGGFLIAKIHQLSGRIFSQLLKESKITEINPAQGRILFVLWQRDGIFIQELAKQTSLGKSTLTSMLDRLERTGFIKRVSSPKDRRKILIYRTEKDKSFQDLYLQVSQRMTNIYYANFLEEEITQFENYLSRILTNLKKANHAYKNFT
jgi:DNA-binding MarR family transcriptional regulator